MNFSEHKALKQVLSLTLAGAMTVCLFSGCMKKGDETLPSDDTKPNINLVDDTKPSETETVPTVTTEPPYVITENTATVINQLSVRKTPSKEAPAIGTLDAGDMVELLRSATAGGLKWGYITEPYEGWICMDYVEMAMAGSGNDLETSTPGGDNATEPTTSGEGDNTSTTAQSYKGVVTGNGLNIRNDPSTTTGTLVGQYNKGDVITILETKNGWGRTDKGWVNLTYVNASTTNTTTGNNNSTTGNNTGSTTNTTTSTGNGSTTVIARGIVTAETLNVRPTASTEGDQVKTLSQGDRVEILEKSGNWGRIKDGWISLNYVYQDGTTGTNAAKGIITATDLRIRSGPGTTYDPVGSYPSGSRVNILAQFTFGNTTWGCTDKGWISMDYVYVDGSDIGESGNGTVNTDGLRIRSGPGTDYDVVGSYNAGEAVTILYQLTVGDTTWGCTNKGWISLSFVNLS